MTITVPENEEFDVNMNISISEPEIENFLANSAPNLSSQQIVQFLQNQKVISYFKFRPQQYCDFLSTTISKIETPDECIGFIKSQHVFSKHVRSQTGFTVSFLENAFPTFVEICGKFSENQQVFEEISRVIQRCVFRDFDCNLNDIFHSKKCKEDHDFCKRVLKNLVKSPSSIAFKLILYSLSNVYKDSNQIYRMLIVLTQILGFDLKEDFDFKLKYAINEPSLDSLEIVDGLFDVVTKLDVDLNAKIGDVTFRDFLTNILKSIFGLTKKPNCFCYRILLKLMTINPLIVETALKEIVIYFMLNEISEQSLYEQVVIGIFEVFSKLHRIQNFIAKLIPILKSAIMEPAPIQTVYSFRSDIALQNSDVVIRAEIIFPKSVLEFYTQCIVILASWQTINLFKTMLFHLNAAVDDIQDDGVYLEILGCLTCQLLESVRMAEHTVAPSTVLKFVNGLGELREILGKLGKILLHKEHNHLLMKTFLKIAYNWAEIFLTIDYYSTNDDIKMEKNMDSNFSAHNLHYLHPYLSDKQWCLIAERIKNFGDDPCAEILQKLMVQKVKALLISDESCSQDVVEDLIRNLSISFDIFNDRFVVSEIVPQMAPEKILTLAEVLVRGEKLSQFTFYDSQIITDGILSVIFVKLNKTLLKHKRKLDENSKKRMFSRAFAFLPKCFLLSKEIEMNFKNISEIILSEQDEDSGRIDEEKILLLLEMITQIPVIFSSEATQKLSILLLLALKMDLKNCSTKLQLKCETLILSFLQHNKLTLVDIFQTTDLTKIISSFHRSEEVFQLVVSNIFKSDPEIKAFAPAIDVIKSNLDQDTFLNFATAILKMKKTKISAESRILCLGYRNELCQKIGKLILKNEVQGTFIEALALILKQFLGQENSKLLEKLKTRLVDYLEFCFLNGGTTCLSLFSTVLHNKSKLGDGINDGLIIKIWDCLKGLDVGSKVWEEYCQVVMLVTTLIPNEKFDLVLGNLFEVTNHAVDSKHFADLFKHLKTWSSILSTNFNTTKTTILRKKLEFLMESLIKILLKHEEAVEEIMDFQIKIIQTNHVPLTSSLIDFFLSTIPLLQRHNFFLTFPKSVSLLENLLKHRNPLMMDRLPPFLLQYRFLLKQICTKSGSQSPLTAEESQRISDCAHKFEKLTRLLVDCGKDMARIAMYLISDILAMYEIDVLLPTVKKHLDNCIYALISLCDQHAVQYLLRVLSNASTEIFKIMFSHYKKYYRFTGKV